MAAATSRSQILCEVLPKTVALGLGRYPERVDAVVFPSHQLVQPLSRRREAEVEKQVAVLERDRVPGHSILELAPQKRDRTDARVLAKSIEISPHNAFSASSQANESDELGSYEIRKCADFARPNPRFPREGDI